MLETIPQEPGSFHSFKNFRDSHDNQSAFKAWLWNQISTSDSVFTAQNDSVISGFTINLVRAMKRFKPSPPRVDFKVKSILVEGERKYEITVTFYHGGNSLVVRNYNLVFNKNNEIKEINLKNFD